MHPDASIDDRIPLANDASPVIEEFNAVEKLQETAEEAGWSIVYRQLDSGPPKFRTLFQDRGEISLVRQSVNRAMETIGETPADTVTIVMSISGAQLRANGRPINDDNFLIAAPGSEVKFSTGPSLDAVSVYVPEPLFNESARMVNSEWKCLKFGEVYSVGSGCGAASAMRQLIMSFLHPAMNSKWNIEHGSALALGASTLLNQSTSTPQPRYRNGSLRRWQALNRAREYIENSLSDPIRMADLCAHASVSLSTLERIFNRELHTSPSQYIVARRLDAVRRALTGEDHPDKPIAMIAMDHGFTHVGRFSATYRKYFGLLPSQERRYANQRT